MNNSSSFIDVRQVSLDYKSSNGIIARLSGNTPVAQSVLRNLTFQLAQGDQVVLFGHASSGKSTVLKLLTGVLTPSGGTILINGQDPQKIKNIAAGLVSMDESEPVKDSVYDVLHTFGKTHGIDNLPARIGELGEFLKLGSVIGKEANRLSTTERIKLNLARAALADSPVVLLDDIADHLEASFVKELLKTIFKNRTVVITTRFTRVAEDLGLPIMLLHNSALVQQGTRDEIATAVSCPRVMDAWVEGLRYDLFRKLKAHRGVVSVRLIPSSSFVGQKLRITARSSRYLPGIYDIISQAPLIRVEELPVSLLDIIDKL